MSVIVVSDASFNDDVLLSDKPVLVDFWADWCSPCKQLLPVLENLSADPELLVKLVKLNVTDNPEMPAKYGIRSLPTLFIFKDGEVVANHVGGRTEKDLREWIQSTLTSI